MMHSAKNIMFTYFSSIHTAPWIACVGLIVTIIIVAVIAALICYLRGKFINYLKASFTNCLRGSTRFGISAVNLNWIVTIPTR